MKNLTLLNDNTNVKLGDTGTLIQFKASDNGAPVALEDGQTAIFRIKNDLGFLKSIDVDAIMRGYVFEFDTSALEGLVAGNYQIELVITKSAEDISIYPDKGFVTFHITENALSIVGEQLPTMTLEAFKNEIDATVNTRLSEASETIEKNLKQSIGDTANQASQKAQAAIDTADTAQKLAQSIQSEIGKVSTDTQIIKQNVASVQSTTTALSTMIQNISQSLSAWNNSQEIGGDSTNIDFNQLNSGVYSVIGWYSNVMDFPNFPTVMNNKEFMMFVYKTTTGNVTLQIIVNADLKFYLRSLAPGGVENVGWKQIQVLG